MGGSSSGIGRSPSLGLLMAEGCSSSFSSFSSVTVSTCFLLACTLFWLDTFLDRLPAQRSRVEGSFSPFPLLERLAARSSRAVACAFFGSSAGGGTISLCYFAGGMFSPESFVWGSLRIGPSLTFQSSSFTHPTWLCCPVLGQSACCKTCGSPSSGAVSLLSLLSKPGRDSYSVKFSHP